MISFIDCIIESSIKVEAYYLGFVVSLRRLSSCQIQRKFSVENICHKIAAT